MIEFIGWFVAAFICTWLSLMAGDLIYEWFYRFYAQQRKVKMNDKRNNTQ